MKLIASFASLGRELSHAIRVLHRRPAFALAAVLTLAIGIGATTAIFSVVYSVLIKPLSYPNADELVSIRHSGTVDEDLWASPTMYLTYRGENRTFTEIGAWREDSSTLTDDRGEPERVPALQVTAGTLEAIGVQPMRGRWFAEQEHGPAADGAAPVILSFAFWQRRFGADEAVLGRELSIDSRPSQVVGIMPPDFRFLDMTPQPDVIVAVQLDPAEEVISSFNFNMLARLGPGATAAEARADIERLLPIWLDAWPIVTGFALTKEDIANWHITPLVRPLKEDLVGGVASTLWALIGAIAAVLLVACANVANLMLVRADTRRQEFAVRAALGAAPARIAAELLIESLVLGVIGGALGLGLAYIGVQVVVAIGPSDLPRLEEIAVHPPVLAFTTAISLVSTVLFGSIPALKHALHLDSPITGAARGASADRERSTTRSALVVVQVALALVLVVSAALMIRTFQALRDVDLGFSDPATIQTARIWIPTALFPDSGQWTPIEREILDRVAALPGVDSVGFASDVPMSGVQTNGPVPVEVETNTGGDAPTQRRWIFVSPGYFQAMGISLIAGRDVTWSDLEAGGRVAVVSEDFARDLAGEPAAALGQRVRLPFGDPPVWREVVGVARSVRQDGLFDAPPSTVYWPALVESFGRPNVTFAIRSERAGTSSFVEEIQQAVRSVSGSIPIGQVRTVRDLYAGSLARTSFTLVMLAIAGAMALALGVIGIYGVIAYIVSQRAREIGIRAALGAEPRQLTSMFLRHGLALSGVGAVLGLGGAMALERLMSSLLFGIGPMDVLAYLAALGVTVAAAAIASYLPARRAAMIDPVETLKAE